MLAVAYTLDADDERGEDDEDEVDDADDEEADVDRCCLVLKELGGGCDLATMVLIGCFVLPSPSLTMLKSLLLCTATTLRRVVVTRGQEAEEERLVGYLKELWLSEHKHPRFRSQFITLHAQVSSSSSLSRHPFCTQPRILQ